MSYKKNIFLMVKQCKVILLLFFFIYFLFGFVSKVTLDPFIFGVIINGIILNMRACQYHYPSLVECNGEEVWMDRGSVT